MTTKSAPRRPLLPRLRTPRLRLRRPENLRLSRLRVPAWFTNVGVRTRVLSAVLLAAVAAAAVGVLGIAALGRTNDATEQLYSRNFAGLDAATALRQDVTDLQLQVASHALTDDRTAQSQFERAITADLKSIKEKLDAYGTQDLTGARATAFDAFVAGYEEYAALINDMLTASRSNDTERWATLRQTANPKVNQMSHSVVLLVDKETEEAAAAAESAHSSYEASRLQVVVVVTAGLVAAVALSILISGSIVRGLRRVERVCAALADGDLTVTAGLRSRDEVGRMGRALDTAVGRLRGTVGTIEESATALAAAAEEMSASSTQIAETAEATSAQADVVSAAADEVSRHVQAVAAGAEQMGSSIQEIANNATQAAEVARLAVAATEVTSETVNRLGDSSREIGNVVKVITSIAEQTNLLALNATIEAARAGAAGKGFAVVAGEVKELAQETAKATEDIGRRVDAIQADTAGAVRAIADIADVISQVNDFQLTIASAVEEQSVTTAEINRSVGEAAVGSGEIAANIAGVAGAADLTTQGISDTRESVSSLARMSADLRSLVGQFVV